MARQSERCCLAIPDAITETVFMFEYTLYFFIAYSCGVLSLGMLAVSYLKTRNETLAYYSYFQAVFTTLILIQVGLGYLSDIAPHYEGGLSEAIASSLYASEFIIGYLTLFALIVFCLHFLSVPRFMRHAAVSGGILLVSDLTLHAAVFVWPNTRFAAIVLFFNDHLSSAALLYLLILGVSRYKMLATSAERLLMKRLLIIFLIALPSTYIEMLLETTMESSLSFYPLIYLCETILLTHYFVKQALFSHQPAVPAVAALRSETAANPLLTQSSEKILTPVIPESDIFERYGISPREKELALLALQGRNNSEIAEMLFISVSTVKTHLSNIYEKFGVKNRYELITFLANTSATPSTASTIHASDE